MAKEKKKKDLVKFNTLKRYIIDNMGMKSSSQSVKDLQKAIEEMVTKILNDAGAIGKKDGRNTISEEDISGALEMNTKQQRLTWEETAAAILDKNPTQLSKITKAITAYVEQ